MVTIIDTFMREPAIMSYRENINKEAIYIVKAIVAVHDKIYGYASSNQFMVISTLKHLLRYQDIISYHLKSVEDEAAKGLILDALATEIYNHGNKENP